jgi:hypothetical protein
MRSKYKLLVKSGKTGAKPTHRRAKVRKAGD